ncbi:MAG: DUF2079 domain-containing protein [Acidobacteriota bacterium]|nr:DUF2079 domain-containing protein [Acidobacteriota bacterium]
MDRDQVAARAADAPSPSSSHSSRPARWRSLRAHPLVVYGPLALAVGAYAAWFITLSMRMYDGYNYPPFDLSIFDQGLWLLSHGHSPFVTIMGRSLFGDHTSFILLPLVVIYRLFPEPQGILVLQTLVLASAALPIFLIARRRLSSLWQASALAVAFLASPILQQGNLDQFHPEAIQVLVISWALYGALEWRPTLLAVTVLLALMVKEDAVMLVLPLTVRVALRRDRGTGVALGIAALVWAYLANYWVIPGYLHASSFYAGRLPFGGVHGTLATLLHAPGAFFSYLASQGRPFYLWQLGATVGFVFLANPEIAAVGVLVAFENVLSNDVYMHQILYQYSLPLVPVLVVGATIGVARLRRARWRAAAVVVTLVAALWTSAVWGFLPFSVNRVVAYQSTSARAALSALEARIPPDASVCAWYPLVAHLDNRVSIYVWPTPFSAQNWGLFDTTGQWLARSRTVRYLLLPSVLDASTNLDVFERIVAHFSVVESRGGFTLYRRRY